MPPTGLAWLRLREAALLAKDGGRLLEAWAQALAGEVGTAARGRRRWSQGTNRQGRRFYFSNAGEVRFAPPPGFLTEEEATTARPRGTRLNALAHTTRDERGPESPAGYPVATPDFRGTASSGLGQPAPWRVLHPPRAIRHALEASQRKVAHPCVLDFCPFTPGDSTLSHGALH